ncbi:MULTISPECIES: hypothetical protein [Micromonospora]|uniref:hypothetical protein n=1 Tax=Micromonospora TaxID=1873 RepID=UPI001E46169F|nr:hypothetical protein [Micromonospora sp. S4605]
MSTVAADAGDAATATSMPPTITAAVAAASRDDHLRRGGTARLGPPMATMILLRDQELETDPLAVIRDTRMTRTRHALAL